MEEIDGWLETGLKISCSEFESYNGNLRERTEIVSVRRNDEGVKISKSLRCRKTLHSVVSVPAVCGFGRHDIGKQHLHELPQVQQLVSPAVQSDVEVGAIFVQSRLLQAVYSLHYKQT